MAATAAARLTLPTTVADLPVRSTCTASTPTRAYDSYKTLLSDPLVTLPQSARRGQRVHWSMRLTADRASAHTTACLQSSRFRPELSARSAGVNYVPASRWCDTVGARRENPVGRGQLGADAVPLQLRQAGRTARQGTPCNAAFMVGLHGSLHGRSVRRACSGTTSAAANGNRGGSPFG
jgi:hypothetical protein